MKKGKKFKQQLMVYGIGALMLLSGFYFGLRSIETRPGVEEETPPIVQYNVVNVGNRTLNIKINETLNDLIALPRDVGYVNMDVISRVYNNLVNVTEVTTEVSNSYVFFKFHKEGDVLEYVDNIRKILDQELRSYTLFRGYTGVIGSDKIYVVGYLDHQIGSNVSVILFQRRFDNGTSDLIGFEQRVLENKTVKNVTE